MTATQRNIFSGDSYPVLGYTPDGASAPAPDGDHESGNDMTSDNASNKVNPSLTSAYQSSYARHSGHGASDTSGYGVGLGDSDSDKSLDVGVTGGLNGDAASQGGDSDTFSKEIGEPDSLVTGGGDGVSSDSNQQAGGRAVG